MNNPFHRAPHAGTSLSVAPDRGHNAALLIDFDNVTMGIRSDLSRELKALLNSEIIRGKVAVQRAYADWRRYPQYIVPLSEASIDLIFAPAYGSSKKNATDIRLAIDALELIFIRPEIYTFILLSGDSDFSSLVLKLKEYGKYVIGVGLQESSSDILVQNCDEYYSYSSLTGLTKTTDAERAAFDPWVLVEKAVERMVQRNDVMRSDRLKQVMVELDPSFEERKFGFAKFSKFLAEAAGKGMLELKKLDNGQYDVGPGGKRRVTKRTRRSVRAVVADDPRGADEPAAAPAIAPDIEQEFEASEADVRPDTLDRAYSLLREAMAELREAGRHPARDSDVKRRLLQLRSSFDEGELGFPKFSKFLKQAHDDHIVKIERLDNGQFEVSLPGTPRSEGESTRSRERGGRRGREPRGEDDSTGRRGRGPRREREPRGAAADADGERTERRPARGRAAHADPEEASPASVEVAPGPDQVEFFPEPPPVEAQEVSGSEADEAPPQRRSRTATAERVAPQPEAEFPVREESVSAEPESAPEPRIEAPAVRATVVTVKLPVSTVTAGGLTPRSQKRGRGREGPPPLFEGQAVKAPTTESPGVSGDHESPSE